MAILLSVWSGSQLLEQIDIRHDLETAAGGKATNVGREQVPVKRAQNAGRPAHCGVQNCVIVRIVEYDRRTHFRLNEPTHALQSQEKLLRILSCETQYGGKAGSAQHVFDFVQNRRGENENMLRESPYQPQDRPRGPFGFPAALTRTLVSRVIIIRAVGGLVGKRRQSTIRVRRRERNSPWPRSDHKLP